MIREDLRHCLFCGGRADMLRTKYYVYIQCENLNMNDDDGHLVQVSANTEEQAIDMWNRRYGA